MSRKVGSVKSVMDMCSSMFCSMNIEMRMYWESLFISDDVVVFMFLLRLFCIWCFLVLSWLW